MIKMPKKDSDYTMIPLKKTLRDKLKKMKKDLKKDIMNGKYLKTTILVVNNMSLLHINCTLCTLVI